MNHKSFGHNSPGLIKDDVLPGLLQILSRWAGRFLGSTKNHCGNSYANQADTNRSE